MKFGRVWARGDQKEKAYIVEDSGPSPLDKYPRGTYVQIQLSPNTSPKSLNKIASSTDAWKSILRTKTAIGQILLDCEPVVPLKAKLRIVEGNKITETNVETTFIYPHKV